MEFSKCPDFVVNKGHYFGTDMLTDLPGLRANLDSTTQTSTR